jgi:hypothetical protein
LQTNRAYPVTLDALTQKQIDELRASGAQIWKYNSQVMVRDWRKYLWLDYDLSALPCGSRAEAALKGYFGEKKRLWAPISPCQSSKSAKPYGQMCFQATITPCAASNLLQKRPKLL